MLPTEKVVLDEMTVPPMLETPGAENAPEVPARGPYPMNSKVASEAFFSGAD